MDTIHWPGLAAWLRGTAIVDLWYYPKAGLLVILLEGGRSVLVSADWEVCQVVTSFSWEVPASATPMTASELR